jgi:S1-C subfamily serine protease
MRPGLVALVAFAAALVGGGLVYALGEARDDGAPRPRPVAVSEIDASGDAASVPVRVRPGAFDPTRIYAARAPGVVTMYAYYTDAPAGEHAAQGSGFVVSPDGYMLTSAHVVTSAGQGTDVRRADAVYVAFADGDRVKAKIVGWDLFDDIGVVQVDVGDHPLRPVPLGDSSTLRVGAQVAAIGSPFAQSGSLAVGVVSAVGRSVPSLTSRYFLSDAIQTDAAITHGNSGGPLLDARGNAVGVNAQIRTETGQEEGVGFAVPINAAKRSLRQLIATGRVRYPYVGIATDDLTPSLAAHLGTPVRRGALISTVTGSSPAASAGLRGGDKADSFNGIAFRRGGDVLVAIGGRPVRQSDDVARLLIERHRPGETVSFTIVRDGSRRTVAIHLGTRPANPDSTR